MGKLAFAMYKPKKGKDAELLELLKDHLPTLRKYELITDKGSFFVKSGNGTFIEIFEWASEEAKNVAHQHPAIMKIWGKMMPMCEFPAMKDLPEAAKSFPNFEIVEAD
jgi:hypothetical protein